MATGTITKEYPKEVTDVPAIIGVKLVAAAGGCRQRITNITKTELPTAVAAAVDVSGIFNAQAIPMIAETNCPPTNGQGCAKGLLGIKNKIIADAPIEATIIGYPGQGEIILVVKAMKKMEQKQARRESSLALILKLTGSTKRYLKICNIFIIYD
jgi:hypothetical protein